MVDSLSLGGPVNGRSAGGAGNGAGLIGARVLFLLRIPQPRTTEFLQAYERIRHQVAASVTGHLRDQVCQSVTDPEQWLITSEWTSLACFEAWEREAAHRELAGPLRACATEARSMRFVVRAETTGAQSGPTGSRRVAADGG
ncbi:antibiotic biosynthesis monooxygenase [Solwaraspora sp. WMMD1047]|uniref:antibiotic biosynthesis monooxygenase family protein n=1 Tax=Solwaraspora sp. WMMD1047 TaxID=3016102 RepID=UPI002415EC1C|nr:antibiotic biosynthesis monooxygenase family protein [Solwaraspora sp. WMMD1047]MDG4831386.1 antibiotic biosynthesis monooxygenase [Solwaraspora sp. WMMD1047]